VYKAIAFDLDGTLYQNWRFYVRIIPFILRRPLLMQAFGRARRLLHRPDVVGTMSKTPSAADFYEREAEIIGKLLHISVSAAKMKVETLIYQGWQRHFRKVQLFPEVRETLAAFKEAGLTLGLLSDFPPETKLRYLGIDKGWDTVLCSLDTGHLKPDPVPFEKLAASLGFPPQEILYVGNSIPYDVRGAKQVGMGTALITGKFSLKSKKIADFTFSRYRQLRDYVLH
jgi:putative hydrolase of the HAD superfamily